jgi:glycosyltransferase involved in cell wall biosynthesis
MSKEEVPFVSVILPVRNEEQFIIPAVEAIFAQDYPADYFELIIAEGMSTDGTIEKIQELIKKYPAIRLLKNPEQIVPTGLNLAIKEAKGDVVVRMDGHCKYPLNYVSKLVELLAKSAADNVGGVLIAAGHSNYAQSAIRLAYRSPLSVGSALRSYDSQHFVREVDDVHGGCWHKAKLLEVGGFDEKMVRNQDDELSFRIRNHGGRILQDASIRVEYYVRDSFKNLFKQFLQYGYWKIPVILKHPKQSSLRHFVPAVFVVVTATLIVAAPFFFNAFKCLLFVLIIYCAALASTSLAIVVKASAKRYWPGVIWALICMQIGYGVGFLFGALRILFRRSFTEHSFQKLSR